ncbi:CorA metal ion transporter [Coemansia sp. RSA 2167]|nr:CorA metal ion transporter [Coemansia sp. RSA 2167]KAJ2144116.1 CorA metal ion transporter [Coemansia sp. RSA 637]KAJ2279603.1 CorA metal ion transporter [Coemansia sp. RSA 370]KAJ2529773.1 CorA metal ion transporter [Coemansia sp. RSA 1935]
MRVLLLSDINGEQWAQDLSILDETEKYGWLWLDVTDPTQCEVELLGQRFGLHPLTVEDIVDDATSQDKMERIGGYALVMYRTTTDMTAETAFSIVVGSGWILSFHTSAAQMHVDRVLDRLQEHSNELLGSSFVVYALIDEITDWLTMTMTQIEHDVVQIDNAVMTQVPEEHTGMLQHMGLLRRRIVGIQRLQLGKPDVVRRVARVLGSNDELGHHFRDVCDHLAALGSLCTQCEVVLSRAHSNFMAQMSLKMNQTTHGLGMFSNRWLVLLGLMLPLQLVAMAFGQNVYVPWMYSDQPLRFDTIAPWLGIMGCILLAFAVGLGFAWYRNYLSR